MELQVPDYIRSLVPYVPGKPIEETQRELRIKKVIKLASNENPLGPSPKALRAIQLKAKELHRYPDASGYRLKELLSKKEGVSSQSIILGNGSNEIIDQIIRTFCLPGDAMVTHAAAFVAYKICAQIHGVETVEVPLSAELRLNFQDLVEAVRKNSKVKVVFLANPNNPTGVYLSWTEIKEGLKQLSSIRGGSVLVVMDYAYLEYATAKDFPKPDLCRNEYQNLVVLRTFSKIYGLAGIRVGYGIAVPGIIQNLEKVRQPFNVNSMGLAAAEAALMDTAFVRKAQVANQKGMNFWEKKLSQMGIPFWPSQGNFILIDTQKGFGKTGKEVFELCLNQGVIFRPIANYGLPNALRITIGTEEENETAVEVLNQVMNPRMRRK